MFVYTNTRNTRNCAHRGYIFQYTCVRVWTVWK